MIGLTLSLMTNTVILNLFLQENSFFELCRKFISIMPHLHFRIYTFNKKIQCVVVFSLIFFTYHNNSNYNMEGGRINILIERILFGWPNCNFRLRGKHSDHPSPLSDKRGKKVVVNKMDVYNPKKTNWFLGNKMGTKWYWMLDRWLIAFTRKV